MDNERFDRVTLALATGRSRRSALGLLAGGAVSLFAGARVAAAVSNAGGNSACVEICKELYGPGEEQGQCIAAGARDEGPCVAPVCENVPAERTVTFYGALSNNPDMKIPHAVLRGFDANTTYSAELCYQSVVIGSGTDTIPFTTDRCGFADLEFRALYNGALLNLTIDGTTWNWQVAG